MLQRDAFIIVIGEDSVLFYEPGRAPEVAASPLDPAAETWLARLRARPSLPVRVSFDGHGQEFVVDALPRLGPLDRPKLVSRRLDQHLAATGIRGAMLMGKLGGARESWLFAGLTQTEMLERWRDWLGNLPNRLADFSLLPVELTPLALALRSTPAGAEDWTLLVLPQRLGGYRHLVLRGENFVFSRLTPLPMAGLDALSLLRQDIQSTLGYLARQELASGSPLDIILALRGTEAEVLPSELDLGTRRARILRLTDLADARLKLKLSFTPQGGEDIAAALLRQQRKVRLPLSMSLLRERLAYDQLKLQIYTGRMASGAAAILSAIILVVAMPNLARLAEPMPEAATGESATPLAMSDLEIYARAHQSEAQWQSLQALITQRAPEILGNLLRFDRLVVEKTAATEAGEGSIIVTFALYALAENLSPVEGVAAAEAFAAALRRLRPTAEITLAPPLPNSNSVVIALVKLQERLALDGQMNGAYAQDGANASAGAAPIKSMNENAP